MRGDGMVAEFKFGTLKMTRKSLLVVFHEIDICLVPCSHTATDLLCLGSVPGALAAACKLFNWPCANLTRRAAPEQRHSAHTVLTAASNLDGR